MTMALETSTLSETSSPDEAGATHSQTLNNNQKTQLPSESEGSTLAKPLCRPVLAKLVMREFIEIDDPEFIVTPPLPHEQRVAGPWDAKNLTFRWRPSHIGRMWIITSMILHDGSVKSFVTTEGQDIGDFHQPRLENPTSYQRDTLISQHLINVSNHISGALMLPQFTPGSGISISDKTDYPTYHSIMGHLPRDADDFVILAMRGNRAIKTLPGPTGIANAVLSEISCMPAGRTAWPRLRSPWRQELDGIAGH